MLCTEIHRSFKRQVLLVVRPSSVRFCEPLWAPPNGLLRSESHFRTSSSVWPVSVRSLRYQSSLSYRSSTLSHLTMSLENSSVTPFFTAQSLCQVVLQATCCSNVGPPLFPPVPTGLHVRYCNHSMWLMHLSVSFWTFLGCASNVRIRAEWRRGIS